MTTTGSGVINGNRNLNYGHGEGFGNYLTLSRGRLNSDKKNRGTFRR